MKNSYKNNKFKVPATEWSKNIELHGGSYSAFDIEDYFEYIIKKHETVTVILQ